MTQADLHIEMPFSEFMTEGATRGLKRSADFVGFENIPKDLMSEPGRFPADSEESSNRIL
jgi:hypothetical protein